MSPAAVTIGAATLSRSQSRRTEHGDDHDRDRPSPRSTTGTRRSPRSRRSRRSRSCSRARRPPRSPWPGSRARARSTSDIEIDAARFWPTTVSRRRDSWNVPVWIAVPRRLPSAPNTLPRMPMAAGTSTRRPGSASRVPVIEPRVSPARRSPPELMQERDEARSDPGGVRAQQRAKARNDGSPRTQHRYSEARSFPQLPDRGARLPQSSKSIRRVND